MELTGRQRDLLSKLLDLYGKTHHPVHYSTIAERLGVSPMTAYDMLRLLEERGFVVSHYVLPENGPGRSTVVFSPTSKSIEIISRLAKEDWDREEWEKVKDQILETLRTRKGSSYFPLLDEILQRIPEHRSPMVFVTEMITAILLTLHQSVGEKARDIGIFDRLRSLDIPGGLGLNALAGLTLGLSLVERANRHVTSTLLSYIRRYEDCLVRLNAENKDRLSAFAREVMSIIEA